MPVKTIKMHKVKTDDPKTFGKVDDYKTYGTVYNIRNINEAKKNTKIKQMNRKSG